MRHGKIASLIFAALLFVGCAESRRIGGTMFEPQGVFTLDDKDPCIHYEVSGGNVFWGIVLSETVIAPVYFFGWALYNPIIEKYQGCLAAQKK